MGEMTLRHGRRRTCRLWGPVMVRYTDAGTVHRRCRYGTQTTATLLIVVANLAFRTNGGEIHIAVVHHPEHDEHESCFIHVAKKVLALRQPLEGLLAALSPGLLALNTVVRVVVAPAVLP